MCTVAAKIEVYICYVGDNIVMLMPCTDAIWNVFAQSSCRCAVYGLIFCAGG